MNFYSLVCAVRLENAGVNRGWFTLPKQENFGENEGGSPSQKQENCGEYEGAAPSTLRPKTRILAENEGAR